MTEFSFFTLSPYLLLLASVVLSLMGRRNKFVFLLLGIALILAFLNQQFNILGLAILLMTPLSLFVWVNHHFSDSLRKLCLLVFLGCAAVLGLHFLPGLDNLKIFDQVVLNKNSSAFDMYLNFDKVYLALVTINILPPLERETPWRESLVTVLKYFVVATLVLLPLAWSTGFLEFQLNDNPYIFVWAVNNFFFVCFFEEIFFRRFLQNQLVHSFRNVQYGDLVAIFLVALAFGCAHFAGGWLYVGLSAIAGIIYGFCFYHTCNYRSAMLLHFLVNLGHVLFFTYPSALS